MDLTELIAALATAPEEEKARLRAALSAAPDAEKDKAEAEDLEKEAGVTKDDEDPKDAEKSASMRAMLRIARASRRQIAALAGTAATLAEAAVVAKIGTMTPPSNMRTQGRDEKFQEAITAALTAGCKNEAEAIRFVAAKKPELYNAHMSGGAK